MFYFEDTLDRQYFQSDNTLVQVEAKGANFEFTKNSTIHIAHKKTANSPYKQSALKNI